MNVFTYTNKGGRDYNQDYIAYTDLGKTASVYVLADGMGGYEYGDEAAQIVTEAIIQYVRDHFGDTEPFAVLRKAFIRADDRLNERRKEHDEAKMGSVVVAVIVVDRTAYVAWLGDSRCYQIRSGKIAFETEDHSLINDLKKVGTYKDSDYERFAACVTKSLMGDGQMLIPDMTRLELEEGDLIVLCSDGIHKEMAVDMLPDADENLKDLLDAISPTLPDNCSIIRITVKSE